MDTVDALPALSIRDLFIPHAAYYIGASRKVEILAGISYCFELIYKDCSQIIVKTQMVLIF